MSVWIVVILSKSFKQGLLLLYVQEACLKLVGFFPNTQVQNQQALPLQLVNEKNQNGGICFSVQPYGQKGTPYFFIRETPCQHLGSAISQKYHI